MVPPVPTTETPAHPIGGRQRRSGAVGAVRAGIWSSPRCGANAGHRELSGRLDDPACDLIEVRGQLGVERPELRLVGE